MSEERKRLGELGREGSRNMYLAYTLSCLRKGGSGRMRGFQVPYRKIAVRGARIRLILRIGFMITCHWQGICIRKIMKHQFRSPLIIMSFMNGQAVLRNLQLQY